MISILEYVYYRLYLFMQRTPGRSTAETGASALMATTLLFYTLAIITKILFALDYTTGTSKGQTQAIVLVIGLVLYFLIYMYFEKSGRYLTLNKRFGGQSPRQFFWKGIGVCFFAIGSLVAMILIVVEARNR